MPTPMPVKPAPAVSPKGKASSAKTISVSAGVKRGVVKDRGEKIGIFSNGGMGKSSLVALLAEAGIDPLFIDLDEGTLGLDVARATCGDDEHLVRTLDEVSAVLHNHELISQFGAVVIDTFTKLEELIVDWVIANIPHEKAGKKIDSIEAYGYGKGYMHVYETALLVLADLDAISRLGVHVVLVCHQVTEKVPSAETAEDFLEYQPRLQSPGKTAKLRERVFEWCNHFFRIDHDRFVEDGKAATGDSRSIHTVRTTTAWAKHRVLPNGNELPEVIPFAKGSWDLWRIMFGPY